MHADALDDSLTSNNQRKLSLAMENSDDGERIALEVLDTRRRPCLLVPMQWSSDPEVEMHVTLRL
jgi:hypothetical protein